MAKPPLAPLLLSSSLVLAVTLVACATAPLTASPTNGAVGDAGQLILGPIPNELFDVPPIPSTTEPGPGTTDPEPVASTSTTGPPAPSTTAWVPPNLEPIAPSPVPLAAVGTANGADTRPVQMRLAALGFWVLRDDGVYDLATRQAVMAYQKYAGLPATGVTDEATAASLSAATARGRATADTGTLVEVDKSKQLLFVVQEGRTVWIFNTSTGNDEVYTEEDQNRKGRMITDVALTPPGLFKVDREREQGWWEGDLGEIYRPKYFKGGVAVHGAYSVPNYPASHGCVRVSVPAMDFIWDQDLMPMRSVVWVHGELPEKTPTA